MKAIDIAEYMVSICVEDKKPISNLQLQKILYFVQKCYLKKDINSPAFEDSIEAWQFGPVVPAVYYRFSGFGAMPITFKYPYEQFGISRKDLANIREITENKRECDPWELVDATHKLGGAWDRVYKGGEGLRQVIPNAYIAEET